ncbi:HPr family phosphocarrier protein [Pelagibaculum spongiae]|uniref:HPr family phosphocarrier protein n=1 Tax=Pelagibaculum spongiae TaxID=2080658 RepID=UPI0013143168|nr:HPr family phosphocarrier protein [Pelagibaculum spongiae]
MALCNRKGLHTRAAGKLVAVASQYDSSLKVNFNGRSADGHSIINLLTLGAPVNSVLELVACGDDAEPLLKAIHQLIASGFDEQEETS